MDAAGCAGRFPLVDRYMGLRLGVDLAGLTAAGAQVVECRRRLRQEMSYGYVHALWWIWLEDGRSAVSVPPGAADPLREAVAQLRCKDELLRGNLPGELRRPVDGALRSAGLPPTDRVVRDVLFACNGSLLRRHRRGDCHRLTDRSIPPARGLRLPDHCFPDGVVYGVLAGGRVASVANAHRTGVMEDALCDVGVETAPAHRKRGYAHTAVSALVEHFTRRGGEARYACSPSNIASRATARSVGFVPYGVSLILAAPPGGPRAE